MDKKSSQGNDKKNSNPRIVTMDSIRNSQPEPERQAYFAGGSEHSGQQILGSGKRKNEQEPGHSHESGEALASAFRRASSSIQTGEQAVSFHHGPRVFSGAGHRLGDRDGEPDFQANNVQAPDQENNPAQVILTLWENGYNIDDGPLQSYDDPQCADLMANIDRGELPTNLLTLEKPGPVHLSVIDKRAEKFKKALKVFGGVGHKLGSPTPPVSSPYAGSPTHSAPVLTSPLPSSGRHALPTESASEPSFIRILRSNNLEVDDAGDLIFNDEDDDSSISDDLECVSNVGRGGEVAFGGRGHTLESAVITPQNATPQNASGSNQYAVLSSTDFSNDPNNRTVLKIRLPHGETMQITVNSSSTISQLRQYLQQCVPSLNNINFTLNLTYPRRELGDDETVNSSEINNSVLVLRV